MLLVQWQGSLWVCVVFRDCFDSTTNIWFGKNGSELCDYSTCGAVAEPLLQSSRGIPRENRSRECALCGEQEVFSPWAEDTGTVATGSEGEWNRAWEWAVRTDLVRELLVLSGWRNPEPTTLLFSRVSLNVEFVTRSHQRNRTRALLGLLSPHTLIHDLASSGASLCWKQEFEGFHAMCERLYLLWYCVLFTS